MTATLVRQPNIARPADTVGARADESAVPALVIDPRPVAGEDSPHDLADGFGLFGRAILIAVVRDRQEVQAGPAYGSRPLYDLPLKAVP